VTAVDDFLASSKCASLASDTACSQVVAFSRGMIQPPLILPWRSDRNVHRWYVVAPPQTARLVMEEVWAHVGVSRTDFDGLPRTHPGDDLLSIAESLWPDAVIARVTLIEGAAHDVVARGFLRLAKRWSSTPRQQDDSPRDLRELLRLHRMSLLADDAFGCSAILDELRRRALLSPVNLLFLEFEQVFRFGTAQEVLDHPEFRRLLGLRRPAALTDLIARSIDRALLRPLGDEMLQTVTAHYEALEAGQRGLVSSLGECRSSSAVLMVALEARLNRRTIRRQSLSFPLDDITREALEEVTEERETGLKSDRESLRERLTSRDYDEVLHLASLQPATREKVDAALFAAQQLNSIESAERALTILENAEASVRDAVLGNQLLLRLVNDLRQLVYEGSANGSPRISSWTALFAAMLNSPSWSGALEVAAHGASEWAYIEEAGSDDTDGELASAFRSLRAASHPLGDSVVPYLLTWFWRCRDQVGGAPLGRLAEAIAEYLGRPGSPAVDVRLLCTLADNLAQDTRVTDWLPPTLELLRSRLATGVPKSSVGPLLDLIAGVSTRVAVASQTKMFCNQLLELVSGRLDTSTPSLAFLADYLATELGGQVLVPTAASEEPAPPASILLIGPSSVTTQVEYAIRSGWPTLRVMMRDTQASAMATNETLQHVDLIVTSPGVDLGEMTESADTGALARVTTGGPATQLLEIERWIASLI
jgi:hypothetical protein